MASGTNWVHSIGMFGNCIRYLHIKIGFAGASLMLSSVILIVPEFVIYLVPSIHKIVYLC